jgi:hypoxanthine phosphoribosyltransferase
MATVRVLIDRGRIAARVAELGAAITSDLLTSGVDQPGRRLVLVPVLTGSLVFVSDLIRHIPLKLSIRPVTVSSYPGAATTSQGASISGDLPTDLEGADVLILDDILDSGRTLGLLRRVLEAQRPRSVRIAVLLDKLKPAGRDEHVAVEYAGFVIGTEFVVGYGLDFDGYFRNLPDIGVLMTEADDQRA